MSQYQIMLQHKRIDKILFAPHWHPPAPSLGPGQKESELPDLSHDRAWHYFPHRWSSLQWCLQEGSSRTYCSSSASVGWWWLSPPWQRHGYPRQALSKPYMFQWKEFIFKFSYTSILLSSDPHFSISFSIPPIPNLAKLMVSVTVRGSRYTRISPKILKVFQIEFLNFIITCIWKHFTPTMFHSCTSYSLALVLGKPYKWICKRSWSLLFSFP